MKISYIGKFYKIYDEEYIARSLEAIGHEVQRLPERLLTHQYQGLIKEFEPDFVLMTKLFVTEPQKLMAWFKEQKIKTVSWSFDLYWDYAREDRIDKTWGFKADKVFTTDGGHENKWEAVGIDHQLLRQGIFKNECYYEPIENPKGIAFVGSDNGLFPQRTDMLMELKKTYSDFTWYGSHNTHELRSTDLNRMYAKTKIIVGDSVYSPYYWSNRVVETLGRGGFLIHQDVPGLKEEFPDLVTYKPGDFRHLKSLIDHYLIHEEDRQDIMKKNWNFVKDNYTMEHKCAELISKI